METKQEFSGQIEYYQFKRKNGNFQMLKKITSIVITALLLFFTASFSFADSAHDATTDEHSTQTAVVVITDPDIAAAEEEEPDCE